MSTRITQQELESYLWGAAVLLRGLIDAGDYKQFIFPLLFYKRVADVWEEEYQAAVADTGGDLSYAKFSENHRFQIPEGAHWNDVRQTPKNVGAAIQRAMRAIESANPDMLDGIFGDAPWTNRERLPDETLKNLIEHFSTQTLSVASVPEDELGNAYEYLIKKFADDSGHTAAEFYTNRTVVHLMTQLLSPQPGESIYDPTCGTGGMLISALDEVKRSGGEYRTLKLYGQERNLITSSIARMNLFLHGVEDFAIIRGDTLADPRHIEGDRLRQFDVILANPPYSIKQWDREAWTQDKWGRNFFGTPPQGRADYAFQQHILASLTAKGRCAVLWPHGVLFRNEEQAMRAKMIEQDWVEAVIGLGPNLFYNSPMESCVVVCNRKKPAKRKGKVMFIDAVNDVTRERAQSFLKPEHQLHILDTFKTFADVPGFAKVATLAEITANAGNLSIPMYVKRLVAAASLDSNGQPASLQSSWEQWQEDGKSFWQQMDSLLIKLDAPILGWDMANSAGIDSDALKTMELNLVVLLGDAFREAGSNCPANLEGLLKGIAQLKPPRSIPVHPKDTDENLTILRYVNVNEIDPGKSFSKKPGNVILNLRKILEVGTDLVLAGAGVATANANVQSWLLPFIALYVLSKLNASSREPLSEKEATTILALWKNCGGRNEISEEVGFHKVNAYRVSEGQNTLTRKEYAAAVNHLTKLKCIDLIDGVVFIRELVSVNC